MRPVNLTDVSLGLNHQLISFVLIKWLILNMNHTTMSAAQSENKTVLLPPRSYWSMKQTGRGRKLKSRREHEMCVCAVEGGKIRKE